MCIFSYRELSATVARQLNRQPETSRRVTQSDLVWAESEKVEALGSYQTLLLGVTGIDAMEVLVVSSKGTGKARVMPKAVCRTMDLLDAALKTARALGEVQVFRLDSGCVPGFRYDACPNR